MAPGLALDAIARGTTRAGVVTELLVPRPAHVAPLVVALVKLATTTPLVPTRPARSAGLTLVKLARSATLKLSASTALVPAQPAALKLARPAALKLATVTIVELARPAALVPAGPTRGSVRVVAKADKALLKRCDDLVHQALVLGAFLVSKAVEAVVLVGHVVY